MFRGDKVEELRIRLLEDRVTWDKNDALILTFEIGHTFSKPSKLPLLASAFKISLVDSPYAPQEYLGRDVLFIGNSLNQTNSDIDVRPDELVTVMVEYQCVDPDLLMRDSVLALCIYNAAGKLSKESGRALIGGADRLHKIIPMGP